MTLCTLGVTLLGLPLIAVAQDAVMPLSRGDSESLDSSHKTQKKIYVNHTEWMVEYAENGRNGDYHPVPWLFMADGTVSAGNLWHGVWKRKSDNKISVFIRMNGSSATDEFEVKFISPSKFTAFKNGQAYRYAVRK